LTRPFVDASDKSLSPGPRASGDRQPRRCGEPRRDLAISDIPIAADGSLSSTTEQDGVIEHAPAHFAYTFSGHFHGAGSSGVPRVAGTFREDVTYGNGAKYTCTSNGQSWTINRDSIQSAPRFPPPAGLYSGGSPQGYGMSFEVSNDGSHIQNVSVSTVSLGCKPSKFLLDPLAISEIPIAADGAFHKTTEQEGIVEGVSAHFTYTFSGHFHGAGSSGKPRAAGTFREDITYENGTTYICTSNDQAWAIAHT
jgi:hypothetical protein